MEEKSVLIVASANSGLGFWTSICVAFACVFGIESNRLYRKQEKVLRCAKERFWRRYKDECYGFNVSDFRITWNGKLSVTVSALAKGKFKEKTEIAGADAVSVGAKTINTNGEQLEYKQKVLTVLRKFFNDLLKGKSCDQVVLEMSNFSEPEVEKAKAILSQKNKTNNQVVDDFRFYIQQYRVENNLD